MATLTKQQTEIIRKEIEQRGISQPELGEDLLDHVCTAVETAMASGENFEQAYEQVMSHFGKNELKQVEIKTKALLEGKKIYYPTILQSFVLLVVYLVLLFFFGLLIKPIQVGDPDFFNQHVILIQSIQVCGSLLLVILIARMELKEASFTKVDILSLNPFPLSIFPIIICLLFVWTIWMEVIHTFIPLSEAMQARIEFQLRHYTPLSLLIGVGIIWPILSEILFRGIILKGLLRKYTPFQAILFSSMLFSASLLNPYSGFSLLIIGLFSGWLFYRTYSLIPSLLVVTLTQFSQVVYILWAKPVHAEQLYIWKNIIGNEVLYYSLGAVSFLMTIWLIRRLKKIFDQQSQVRLFSIE